MRATFRDAALISCAVMAVLTLVGRTAAAVLVVPFSADPAVREVAVTFLRTISLNFVATGLIFSCSSLFQGLGNTVPSLLASATRLLTFVVPGFLLASRPNFTLQRLWYLSVTTVTLQALISLLLLRRELRRRLGAAPPPVAAPPAVSGV